MSTKQVIRLPELATLELADFKSGSLGSDVSEIRSTVRTVAQADWLDRYNAARAAGEVSSWDEWTAAQLEVENDELKALQLVAFASDLVRHLDADRRREGHPRQRALALPGVAGELQPRR